MRLFYDVFTQKHFVIIIFSIPKPKSLIGLSNFNFEVTTIPNNMLQ